MENNIGVSWFTFNNPPFKEEIGLLRNNTSVNGNRPQLLERGGNRFPTDPGADVKLSYTNGKVVNLARSGLATAANDSNVFGRIKPIDGETGSGWVASNGLATTGVANQAWLQVDLRTSDVIQSVKIWPRLDVNNETADVWVLVSPTPFSSNDLDTELARPDVFSKFIAGKFTGAVTVTLPTELLFMQQPPASGDPNISIAPWELLNPQNNHSGYVGRYVRVWKEFPGNTTGQFQLSEIEVRPNSDEVVWEIEIEDMRRPLAGMVVHVGRVTRGTPREGDVAVGAVDADRRWDIMRNHTATHLLQSELRYVLGDHVRQAGSLVAPDRLRFDFSHQGMLTQEQIAKVARSVNDAVLANYPLEIQYMERQAAIDAGATALFGEKYGATVRTVRFGEPEAFSFELCGGTHVVETADIGPFVVVSEEAVAAGIRRIEAVTGRAALELIQQRLGVLDNVATYLKASPADVDRRVLTLLDENQAAQKEIVKLRRELAQRDVETLLTQIEQVQGVSMLAGSVKNVDADTLRQMTDWFRARVPSGVVVLGSVFENRPHFVASVTEDLILRGLDAGKIVKAVAKVVGGGGGGKPTLAQAGGKDASRLNEALAQVKPLLESALGHA